MKVTEIFESIQGEGPYIGHRAIFVRLFGCNLDCPWCDTKYSRVEGGIYYEQTVQQITDIVCRSPSIRHVVVTGGEPTVQMSELLELTMRLREVGKFVTLETNGTNPVDPAAFDKIMVSPKKLEDAERWLSTPEVDFKFVCSPQNIDEILDWLRKKGLTKCYLMPMGITPEEITVGTFVILEKMAEMHQDHIVCPRLHILLGLK
jgi:7-carboxy-7-deazaguanine synthase